MKRVITFICAISLLFGCFGGFAAEHSTKVMAEGIDLVQGKTVRTSGATGEGENGAKAVDGNNFSKWCSTDPGMVKWLVVDLGEETQFDTWVVKNASVGGEFADYNTKDVYLQISNDGNVWTSVDYVKDNKAGTIACKLSEKKSARYVRLYITKPTQRTGTTGDATYARIYGFELYNGGYEPKDGKWTESYKGSATGITITAPNEVTVNSTISLSAKVTPATADQTVTWCSLNTDIVTVDENTGALKGRSKGTAYVTATAVEGAVTATVKVNVIGGDVVIEDVEQTLWIIEENGVYKNEILMYCNNDKEAKECWLKITAGKKTEIQSVGTVPAGKSNVSAFVPESRKTQTVQIAIYDNAACKGTPMNATTVTVEPVRHWTIYVAQNIHMDIGFTQYQETLIDEFYPSVYQQALSDINLSADWDWTSQFKYPAEQSFLLYGAALRYPDAKFYDKVAAAVKSGNLSYPVSFSSSYLATMGQEFLARYGYQSGRYLTDMLGAESSKVVNCTDVQGIPKGSVDTLVGSGAKYFIFRPNNDTTAWSYSRYPRLFYITGNDEDNKLLTWSSYHYSIDELGFRSSTTDVGLNGNINKEFISSLTNKVIANYQTESYPYDAILVDFTESGDNGMYNRSAFLNVSSLNARSKATGKNYVYPKFVNSTETDFFEYIEENYEEDIPVYTQGFEEYWTQGIGTFAYEQGLAKKLNATLPMAETLASLTTVKFNELYPKKVLTDAYDNMNLWFEHTYGSGPSGWSLNELWVWEKAVLYAAQTTKDNVTEDAMETISQNVTTTGKSILVYNGLSVASTNLTNVNKSDLPAIFEITDTATGEKVTYQIDGDQVYFVAKDVPGNGYKTYLVTACDTAPSFTTTAVANENTLENKYFKLTFDATGCLTSMYDKTNNKELIDTDAEYGFNQFIYLNTATPAGSKYQVKGDILQVTKATLTMQIGPVFSKVTASGNAGVEVAVDSLDRTLILYEELNKVDIENTVMKKEAVSSTSQDEEVFFVFPFLMEKFEINHETVSGILNPESNSANTNSTKSQLLTGSALDFFTVNRWIDIGDYQNDYGIIFTPEDSSLMQYGQRRSYSFVQSMNIRNPYLYSWVMNNKWWTNHPKTQPGPVTFHYSITTKTGADYVERKSDIIGQQESADFVTTVIDKAQNGSLAANGAFLTISEDNVVLTTAKMSETNGNGMIFRFYETRGLDTTVTIDLSQYGIASVKETDIVENDLAKYENVVSFSNGILTIQIEGNDYVTVRGLLAGEKVGNVTGAKAVTDAKGTYVTWNKVDNASYYEVYRSTSKNFTAGAGTYLTETDVPYYYDNQVTTKQGTYYYIVKAVKNGTAGNASAIITNTAGEIKDTKAPAAPENLYVDTYYTGRIALVWDYAQDDVAVAGYWLYRDGEQYQYIKAKFNSTMDYELPASGKAEYTVRAVDVYGNESEASNSVYVDTTVLGVTQVIPENISSLADFTASSFMNQTAVDAAKTIYQPMNVADGVIGKKDSGEWVSNWESTPWLQMQFDRTYTLKTIHIYGRNSATDVIKTLVVEFSDGTTETLHDIPADSTKVTLDVSGKQVEWIKFTVTEGSGCIGLSEVEVLRDMNVSLGGNDHTGDNGDNNNSGDGNNGSTGNNGALQGSSSNDGNSFLLWGILLIVVLLAVGFNIYYFFGRK